MFFGGSRRPPWRGHLIPSGVLTHKLRTAAVRKLSHQIKRARQSLHYYISVVIHSVCLSCIPTMSFLAELELFVSLFWWENAISLQLSFESSLVLVTQDTGCWPTVTENSTPWCGHQCLAHTLWGLTGSWQRDPDIFSLTIWLEKFPKHRVVLWLISGDQNLMLCTFLLHFYLWQSSKRPLWLFIQQQ